MTAKWLVPALVYVLAVGALGVTSKLALRDLRWQDLILWSGIGYSVVVFVMLIRGDTQIEFVSGTAWAMLSAAAAIGGLIALYIALFSGEAGKVVPISAAYPAVTLILSALFLSEALSLARVGGVALVVGGVILLTTAK